MESVMDAIRAIRNRRAEMNVPPSRKAALYVLTSKPQVYAEGEGFIQRLAYADTVTMLDKEPENLDGMVTIPTADAKLYIPMGQLVDVAKELDRISKELEEPQVLKLSGSEARQREVRLPRPRGRCERGEGKGAEDPRPDRKSRAERSGAEESPPERNLTKSGIRWKIPDT